MQDARTFTQRIKPTVSPASWIDVHPRSDLSNSLWPCYSPSQKPALLRPQYVRVNKSQLHFSMLTEGEEEKLSSKQITWLPWAKTLQTGCGHHTHQSQYFAESHLLRTERHRHNSLFFSFLFFSFHGFLVALFYQVCKPSLHATMCKYVTVTQTSG